MKEITREDWQKNPTPRMMWVWDDDEEDKEERRVVYILTKEEKDEVHTSYPVITSDCHFSHCAEIEEEKRPCTREELLEMLKKQGLPFLLKKTVNACTIYISYTVAIRIMDNEEVTMCNGECYKYADLCKLYTLLDGTELWIKE